MVCSPFVFRSSSFALDVYNCQNVSATEEQPFTGGEQTSSGEGTGYVRADGLADPDLLVYIEASSFSPKQRF